jgi:hypothetical protein
MFSSNMYSQVLQTPTLTIRVCVDVCTVHKERDEPVGEIQGQCLGIYTHMGARRTISMRAHS